MLHLDEGIPIFLFVVTGATSATFRRPFGVSNSTKIVAPFAPFNRFP